MTVQQRARKGKQVDKGFEGTAGNAEFVCSGALLEAFPEAVVPSVHQTAIDTVHPVQKQSELPREAVQRIELSAVPELAEVFQQVPEPAAPQGTELKDPNGGTKHRGTHRRSGIESKGNSATELRHEAAAGPSPALHLGERCRPLSS